MSDPAPGPDSAANPADRRALLDTTVQVDRQKMPARRERIADILAGFGFTFSTSISLLEFKATVIQECIFLHNELRRPGARFTRVRDRVLESNHPQAKLRGHIFNNLIGVFAPGTAFQVEEAADRRLAEQARLSLENVIGPLYDWFLNESAHSHLTDRIGCTRAAERPVRDGRVFATNLPNCKRGRNKNCRVEGAIRNAGAAARLRLSEACDRADAAASGSADQMRRALTVIDRVLAEGAADLSHGDCRRAGDFLVALEGEVAATHALSTNARDWEHVSSVFGLEFVRVTYPAGDGD